VDAVLLTAIGALIASPLAAIAAMYGSRGANRAAREVGAVTLYDSLTKALAAERDKAEVDEKAAEARACAAEAKVSSLEAEISRLQGLVTQLGGVP
jgi:hypothetical protein